ncbi:hypothetical protein D3C75_1244220 [compost metagenome]
MRSLTALSVAAAASFVAAGVPALAPFAAGSALLFATPQALTNTRLKPATAVASFFICVAPFNFVY